MRPDWPLRSLTTFIEKNLAARAYRDVAVALAWVATTDTQTPRLLLEAGVWWKAAAIDDDGHMQRPPRKADDCPKHPGNWRTSCSACAADKLAGDDSVYNPRRTTAPPTALATIRAELDKARDTLCVHGIRADRCLDRHAPYATVPAETGTPETDDRNEEQG